jgi:hypothetical protein
VPDSKAQPDQPGDGALEAAGAAGEGGDVSDRLLRTADHDSHGVVYVDLADLLRVPRLPLDWVPLGAKRRAIGTRHVFLELSKQVRAKFIQPKVRSAILDLELFLVVSDQDACPGRPR